VVSEGQLSGLMLSLLEFKQRTGFGTCESGEFLNDLVPCFLSGRIKISVGLAGMGKMRFQFQH